MSKSNSAASDALQHPSAELAQADKPGFGWTVYAERINGRFAMIGFLALLFLEFFTRQDFFTWLGLP
ncbi:MAG: high light inducible protein [Symploca sp. SIO2G7]|nr:high light inducible protein [Symploca sp. SIO2G7]